MKPFWSLPKGAVVFLTNLQFSAFEPDFGTTMAQLHEYATDIMPNGLTRFPSLVYRRRTTPKSKQISTLHAEVLPGNREFQDYQFPIYVSANPTRKELTKFGIDIPRDLLAYIALPVLEENELVVQKKRQVVVGGTEQDDPADTYDGGPLLFLVDLGDRLFFQGHEYDVLSIHEDQFIGNSEIPAWLVLACERWRPNSSRDETLDDSNEDWRYDPYN